MLKIKKPGLAFVFVCLSLVFSIVALALFLSTYSVGGYTLSRGAVTCSVLSIWLLIMLMGNVLLRGDKPVWTGIVYALAVFLLIYGLMQFIQPCLTPIGFVFGAGDLNMGDTALNKIVANRSIVTAVFYVLAAVCTVAAAFISADKSFGTKKALTDENGERKEDVL